MGFPVRNKFVYLLHAVTACTLFGCSGFESYYGGPRQDFLYVAQLNPDGSFDRDFSDDVHSISHGVTFRAFPDAGSQPTAFELAVDGAGRIVASGVSTIGEDWLAAGFRGDGRPRYSFYESDLGVDPAAALAIDPSNRPVIAGHELVRLTNYGRVDTTWGSGGRVVLDEPVRDVTTDSFGRVYVTGTTRSSGRKELLVDRYDIDGRIDRTFGIGGRAVISLSREAEGHAIAIDALDRVVVAGRINSSAPSPSETDPDYLFVARFLSIGHVDATFGTGGGFMATALPGVVSLFVSTLKIDSRQRVRMLLTGGLSTIVGLSPNGRLDTDFGRDGVATGPSGSGIGRDIAIDSSDRIYAVTMGFNPADHTDHALIRRFDGTTGSHDTTFPNGVATEVVIDGGKIAQDGYDVSGASIAISRYGKVLIGGNVFD